MPTHAHSPVSPTRAAVPPLLPVLVPLIIASIALNVAFAWLFPNEDEPRRPAPNVRFTAATAAVGIDFTHRHGTEPAPTSMGGGVTVFDANGDRHADIFFVNGAPWPWSDHAWQTPATSHLYLNDGTGQFADVTAAAGLDLVMNAMAAVAGDYDADGDTDLFVTCIGPNRLLRNNGDGTFTETTTTAGVAGLDTDWSTGAAWLDIDRDGQLDLIVSHYLRWFPEAGLAAAINFARVGRSYGTPVGFLDVFPTVYRNNGDGTFTEQRDHAGLQPIDPLTGFPRAKAIALTPLDADHDGHLDLLLHFHTGDPVLFLNTPTGGFAPWVSAETIRREGLSASLAAAATLPLPTVNQDNDIAHILPTLQPERHTLAPGNEIDLIAKAGWTALDYDLDGHRDVFAAHGFMEPDLARIETDAPFASHPTLYWREQDTWQAAPTIELTGLPTPFTARGTATADFDDDGDLDLVIAQNQGPAVYLRNDLRTNAPWLRLTLRATRTHPAAYGARVELHTPRFVTVRTVAPQLGYLAQSTDDLTFGLSEDTRVRRLVITWPSGQRQELRGLAINQHLTVVEP
ncbi:FG-GAP-like repeat-containing protein [Actomonas aquatica]|uniref:CRTAC1 family protein n=1 Tax=Actomonas aquatica TaxID=2866162 RepID=A0ABZ1CCR0_9BACT|nr:CRTAC1 family protein [Opitutus sp. WL0086]WRQ89180.1 CRTAC1 family protein [Opitutus sp. WL0086]